MLLFVFLVFVSFTNLRVDILLLLEIQYYPFELIPDTLYAPGPSCKMFSKHHILIIILLELEINLFDLGGFHKLAQEDRNFDSMYTPDSFIAGGT